MDVHAAAAQAADGTALEQRRAFARHPAAALGAERPGGDTQLLGDALVLLPRDVGRMGIANQHLPLLLRQMFVPRAPIDVLAPAATAINVGACVPRVVERTGGAAQRQRSPYQLPFLRPGGHARRKEQSLPAEVAYRGVERAGAGEGIEEQPHALLHLRVGIEDHLPRAVVHQADRKPTAQLAAASLIEDTAA